MPKKSSLAKKHRQALAESDKLTGKNADDRRYQDTHTARGSGRGRHMTGNYKEAAMVAAIDMKDRLEQLAPHLEKLSSGKTDVTNFLSSVAKFAAHDLAQIATDPNESTKVRLAAIQDLLDRAGHGKINKNLLIGAVDTNASKQELMSLIEGAASKSTDFEIVEDDDD